MLLLDCDPHADHAARAHGNVRPQIGARTADVVDASEHRAAGCAVRPVVVPPLRLGAGEKQACLNALAEAMPDVEPEGRPAAVIELVAILGHAGSAGRKVIQVVAVAECECGVGSVVRGDVQEPGEDRVAVAVVESVGAVRGQRRGGKRIARSFAPSSEFGAPVQRAVRSAAEGHVGALGPRASPRDDLYNPGDGVRAVEHARGAAQHLDPLDVVGRKVREVE